MKIIGANKNFDLTVDLVGSKSESNRALMICHYGGFKPRINNLSASDDTVLLNQILGTISTSTTPLTIDCRNAGTVLRFLATALAFRDGEWTLTGNDRMRQRPVGDLVDALKALGADIDYLGGIGSPPLKIRGKMALRPVFDNITNIHVDISNSSQFASSILLALPVVGKMCTSSMHLDGDLSSLPYIDMTIDVMHKYGAKVERNGRDVLIQPSVYQDVEYTVESDWSSASYWYEIVAFSDNGRVRLCNLHLDSTQGDAVVAQWFEQFGVKSVQDGSDVIIEKTVETFSETSQNNHNCVLQFDFIDHPDLYPTIAATCAGLRIEGRFTGLRNLVHKESDRVAAMTTELSRVEAMCTSPIPIFDSHNDHRIAMALAPLAMKIGAIEINNADVVSKSYPGFWKEFRLIANG